MGTLLRPTLYRMLKADTKEKTKFNDCFKNQEQLTSAHNRVISMPVRGPSRDGVMSPGLAPVTIKMRRRYVFLKHVDSTTIPALSAAHL